MLVFTPELLLARLAAFPHAGIGWIAYSGGMDSAVLLHALVQVRDRLPFELRVVHVDHGLHCESSAWAEHCAITCKRQGVPHRIRRLNLAVSPGESLEAVARTRRYQTMAHLLRQGDLLLTAQHRDDQAETLLLALMRGSGAQGLAAMPAVSPLGAGFLVRPLLEQDRAALLDYAKVHDLDWIEDPGNQDLRFDRNFLRHRVLPVLAERWPACAETIARSAAHCAEAQGLIDRVSQDTLCKVAGRRPATLSISRLADLALPLRRAVLRYWFRKRGLAPPDSRHLHRIMTEVMGARADADPLVAWPGSEVRRYRDDLFALDHLPARPGSEPIHWGGGILVLPSGLGSLELLAGDRQGWDPWSLFSDGLEVRFGTQGLRCRRAGGGHRRSLKNLYQEAGVPPWVRPYVPLIFAPDGLVAVGDIWVCQTDRMAVGRDFRVSWTSDLRGRLPLDALSVAVNPEATPEGNAE